MSNFQKAVKGKKPVRLVIGGPSGSGKTYTALIFAKYLASVTGKPTAAVDTEYYRMSLYADRFDFDVLNRQPPFDPQWLVKTIHEAEEEGFGQFIMDSSTHFYSSEGGLLEIVSNAARSKFGGNQYAGWAVGTPIQNELIETIIRSPLHIIACTRAKQGYVETEKNNRKVYEKAGMDLQQRDGFEYDFDFSLMMDMDNNATVEKGMGYLPTGLYVKKPNEDTIELILKSITENTTDKIAVPPMVSVEKLKADILEIVKSLGGSTNETLMKLLKEYHPSGNPLKIENTGKLQELFVKLQAKKEEVA